MRKILSSSLAVLFAVIVAASPSALFAQALADRVPADALLYVGWKGADTPGTGMQGSHFEAVLKDTNFKAVLDDVMPQVLNKLSNGDPDAQTKFKAIMSLAEPLWRHPTAIFIQATGEAQMPFRAGVICQAGAGVKDLVKQINDHAAQGGQDAKQFIQASESGDLVVVSIGMPTPNLLPEPGGETLAKDAAFAATLKQTVSDPFVVGYVNVEGILGTVDRAVAEQQNDQAAQIWSRVREATGFDGLKRAAFAGRFDGKDWSSAAFVEAPAPRKGLVALFDAKPISPEVMKMIPSTAATAQVVQFDFAALFKEIRNVAMAVDPRAAQGFDQAMGAIQMTIAKNPITDVLEPLGDTWVMYSDANVAGNTPQGFVIVNKLDDAAKAQAGLNGVWFAATNVVNGMQRGGGGARRGRAAQGQPPPAGTQPQGPVALTQEKVGNLTISFAQTSAIGVGWTVNDGKLIIGLSKDGIAKAAAAPTPAQGIDQNPKFAALKQKLAGGEITSFKFLDLPVTAPVMYEKALQGLTSLRELAQQQGITLPEKLLPSMETIKANVAPVAQVTWSDASGFHMKSFKPFPGADAFSNAPNGVMAQGGAAGVAAGFLMPSLARSREAANRVKCASNMRQIGQAILLYANEHKGQYPPDLGTLVMTEDITVECFVCPGGATRIPPNRAGMKPQELADWVNKNSDYVFAGQGLNMNKAPAEQVVLYEKPQAHRNDGMNMLYADGHVEFQVQRMADQIINNLQKKAPPAP